MPNKQKQLLATTNVILQDIRLLLKQIHESQVALQGTAARDGLTLDKIEKKLDPLNIEAKTIRLLLERQMLNLPPKLETMSPGKVEPLPSPEKITQWTAQMSVDRNDQRFLLTKATAHLLLNSIPLLSDQPHDNLPDEVKALIQFASAVETSKET